jgi:hypothetical protein
MKYVAIACGILFLLSSCNILNNEEGTVCKDIVYEGPVNSDSENNTTIKVNIKLKPSFCDYYDTFDEFDIGWYVVGDRTEVYSPDAIVNSGRDFIISSAPLARKIHIYAGLRDTVMKSQGLKTKYDWITIFTTKKEETVTLDLTSDTQATVVAKAVNDSMIE